MNEQVSNDTPTSPARRTLLRSGAVLAAAAAFHPPAFASAGTSRRAIADYLREDATGLAALVRSRKASASELLEIAIARTEALDPAINAVVLRHFELAREAVKRVPADAPLAGVPWLLKDLGAPLAGTVTTGGSRFFRDAVADHDSTLVSRYREAGLVIFGKTASPELGRTATTESTLWGITRNPWNTDYSTGGSSGGAAAAVAAGILPAAHATDGGGSIRIPAALCGLFGMKPTRLRTPTGPARGEGWGGLSIAHAITRSVRDSALILDLSQGPEPGAAYWPPPPAAPYVQEINREPGRLRIGVVRASPIGSTIDPDCMAALERAAALCAGLGHELVDFTLPAGSGEVMRAMGTLMAAGFAYTVRERALAIGREPGPEDLEEANLTAYRQAQQITAIELEFARQAASRYGFEMNDAMQGVDVLLSPTCARAPWKTGVIHLAQSQEAFYRNVFGVSDFTALFNVTGQPAMSVPLHTGANGLPVGTMFAARYGEEGLLFRLAGQLERAAPWKDRLSPLATQGIV